MRDLAGTSTRSPARVCSNAAPTLATACARTSTRLRLDASATRTLLRLPRGPFDCRCSRHPSPRCANCYDEMRATWCSPPGLRLRRRVAQHAAGSRCPGRRPRIAADTRRPCATVGFRERLCLARHTASRLRLATADQTSPGISTRLPGDRSPTRQPSRALTWTRYLALRSSRRICSSASITSSRVTRLRAKLSFRLNSFVGGRNANT